MRTLLVQPESPFDFWSFGQVSRLEGRKTLLPPLGLLTVAALLPPEVPVRLVDLNTGPLRPEHWQWAEAVMVSGMNIHHAGMLALVAEARERGLPVAVGGPHASSQPELFVQAGASAVLVGEAEEGLPELLGVLAGGGRGVVIRPAARPAMDRSPVPRYDLLHLPDYMCMSLQTSRGCPHDCEFCDVVTLFGRRVRHKSPDQVLGELETLYRLGWQGEIFIADDNLIGHRGHARGLLRKLDGWMAARGEPYSFWCQASLELGDDPEMIDLMTQVQVDHVFVGVESPDKAVLQKANKQQNLEHDPAVMLGNLRDGGLTVTASLMVGCDGEEPGVDRRITALVEETAVPLVMINRVVALPGTRLWQRLEAEGRLAPDPRYAQQTGLARRVVPQRDPDQVEAEYLRLWEHLYDPPRFLARNFHYHLAMRPTRAALAQAAGRRPPATSRRRHRLRSRLADIRKLAWLLWRQGVAPGGRRRQFWSQLRIMRRRNPTRVVRYLNTCALGEDLFQVRREVLAGRL